MSTSTRVRADACPGVFATHDAADGPLARIRLPGGAITKDQLGALADAADDLGDGALHLTSRGNIQLRGVTRPGLAARLSAAGLLPSPPHERVRNILASPLSDVAQRLAPALDRALCAVPELAELPGRFLFALDGGRGDVAGEGADVCWRDGALLLDGADTGLRVTAEHAVETLISVARAFLRIRGTAWRIGELPGTGPLLRDIPGEKEEPRVFDTNPGLPIGRIGDAFGVAPVFGRLTTGQARAIAKAGNAVVTPWRSILVLGTLDDDAGLITDPDAPSLGISACIGRPGCAKSLADVRADAARVGRTPMAHFAGCERRCGKPAREHVDVLATEDGYLVDGAFVPVGELAGTLARKGSAEVKGQQ
ncbi:precorrin-3B synthase [Amycolatopsis sp. BJA-103]|uniref:precorrin-3B synthase n=1 Tax=Amycolatopsis sp. BJA-103 TaxID=1911175 RepID=UPI000C772480|nr:precorrin-3B synthase [Amycolatopsis sp. BJA-103]AUI56853.1 precorrin-3B synthase [Amycolatopsis sp. BJA-103]PNE13496.1 precorrin-3B synthase [Amycolatopsis sp. BJA-103]